MSKLCIVVFKFATRMLWGRCCPQPSNSVIIALGKQTNKTELMHIPGRWLSWGGAEKPQNLLSQGSMKVGTGEGKNGSRR